ncbi:MAG: hypothetical protein ACLRMJ_05760 [Alistipes finegoldii]
MFRRLAAVILSVVLLSPGWLGMTGLTLPFAMIPLLWISASYDQTRRSWWRMFGWAALTFALWNISTVWWIWNATPVGPVAATLASTTLNMIAFMLFHTVSKKGPKALAYTLLIAGWIATEYWYTVGEFSWPWLILGNGFSHDVWLVQWYEYTGVFGGSLWVLLCNILFFEAIRARAMRPLGRGGRHAARPGRRIAGHLVELAATRRRDGRGERRPAQRGLLRQIQRPRGVAGAQHRRPADGSPRRSAVHPAPRNGRAETLLGTGLTETRFDNGPGPFWQELADTLRSSHPQALLITGAFTNRYYAAGLQPARPWATLTATATTMYSTRR